MYSEIFSRKLKTTYMQTIRLGHIVSFKTFPGRDERYQMNNIWFRIQIKILIESYILGDLHDVWHVIEERIATVILI